MAGPFYVSSAGDNTTGTSWATAKTTLAAGIALAAAGERVWVSSTHTESTAGITATSAGTPGNPVEVLSGSTAATPPTSLTAGGAASSTSSNNIVLNGSAYYHGITFTCGTTGASFLALNGSSSGAHNVFENCDLISGGTGAAYLAAWRGSTQTSGKTVLKNCRLKFSSTTARLYINNKFEMFGGSIISGGTVPATFLSTFVGLGAGMDAYFDGVDFSNFTSSTNMVEGSPPQQFGRVVFRNCKMPSGWPGSGSLWSSSPTCDAIRAEMWNCSSTDNNIRLWTEDAHGSVRDESTIVHTGGASNGTDSFAWKMVSSSRCKFPAAVLCSPDMFVWNSALSSKTITVEILHFAQGAGTNGALQDDEAWLEVEYQGTSGSPLALFAKDCKTDIMATAADQTTTTEAWDGAVSAYSAATNYSIPAFVKPTVANGAVYSLTTDAGTTAAEPTWGTTDGGTTNDAAGRVWTRSNRQKLSIAVTAAEVGVYIVRVCLAKASKTVYVDPNPVVS